RLDEVVVEARSQRALTVALLPPAAQRDEEDALAPALAAQPPRGLEAAEPWHREIHQHDVRSEIRSDLERRGAVEGRAHLVAEALEHHAEHHRRVLVVVDDEHPARRLPSIL